MNRGVLQSSAVQQMMAAGNPNWCWSIRNNMRPPISTTHHQQTSPFLLPPNLFPHYIPPSTSSVPSWNDNEDQLPESWSQLLMGGLVGDEDKANMSLFQAAASSASSVIDVKQENSGSSCYVYGHHTNDQDFQAAAAKPNSNWSPMMPNIASSPNKSCVTTSTTFSSTNMLDFSTTTKADGIRHPPPDRSSECNSTATGGAAKKARVQASSSTQSTFKVRKEKLGDRITALHQLVSPFGKTDTASVLLEAIGYIRFLQSQIEALSLPYLGSGGSTNRRQQQQHPAVQGERNCIFPEDPGQLLNDNCTKRKGVSDQDSVEEPKKDLRSRGLCLVPVSCTLQVGSDNGADYWAPGLGGGFQ